MTSCSVWKMHSRQWVSAFVGCVMLSDWWQSSFYGLMWCMNYILAEVVNLSGQFLRKIIREQENHGENSKSDRNMILKRCEGTMTITQNLKFKHPKNTDPDPYFAAVSFVSKIILGFLPLFGSDKVNMSSSEHRCCQNWTSLQVSLPFDCITFNKQY